MLHFLCLVKGRLAVCIHGHFFPHAWTGYPGTGIASNACFYLNTAGLALHSAEPRQFPEQAGPLFFLVWQPWQRVESRLSLQLNKPVSSAACISQWEPRRAQHRCYTGLLNPTRLLLQNALKVSCYHFQTHSENQSLCTLWTITTVSVALEGLNGVYHI